MQQQKNAIYGQRNDINGVRSRAQRDASSISNNAGHTYNNEHSREMCRFYRQPSSHQSIDRPKNTIRTIHPGRSNTSSVSASKIRMAITNSLDPLPRWSARQ